ncbi:MAG: deoxynucleoside kinase [bacterium]|nr:deoxynucleoside kinase [bacterium]
MNSFANPVIGVDTPPAIIPKSSVVTSKVTISVAGNIGAGKTTLAQRISEILHFESFLEPVAFNPYLEDFYLQPNRWSFPLQVVFLTQKFKLMQQLQQSPHHRVLDRTLQEDAEVFAATQFHSGFMDQRDWEAYLELYRTVESIIVIPDLILYLQADLDLLLHRIGKRSRAAEKPIALDYLANLNQAYDCWAEAMSTKTRVLKIRAIDYESGPDLKRLDHLVYDIERLLVRTIPLKFQR